jgi:hypothetical protein
MKHEIKISIEAKDEATALELIKALIEIKNALSDSDLKELAKILKSNPSIVKTAKKFLG